MDEFDGILDAMNDYCGDRPSDLFTEDETGQFIAIGPRGKINPNLLKMFVDYVNKMES